MCLPGIIEGLPEGLWSAAYGRCRSQLGGHCSPVFLLLWLRSIIASPSYCQIVVCILGLQEVLLPIDKKCCLVGPHFVKLDINRVRIRCIRVDSSTVWKQVPPLNAWYTHYIENRRVTQHSCALM